MKSQLTFLSVALKSFKTIIMCLLILIYLKPSAQIQATTPNSYFSAVNFNYFALPTATEAILVSGIPLQVIVATTPAPALYWDNNIGMKGSLQISGLNGTVLLDDIVLTKSVNENSVVAFIATRVVGINNTTTIVIIKADWNGTGFIQTAIINIDSRMSNNDWFDRVSISNNETGTESNNRIEIMVAWQKNGQILLNEGYYAFATNNLSWYNTGISVFNGLPGTFKHPDISNKSFILGFGNSLHCGNIVAIQTIGAVQQIVNLGYQSEELNPQIIPLYPNGNSVLYSTSSNNNELRCPRILNSLYGSISVFNVLDHSNKKSDLITAANANGSIYAFNSNQEIETNCTANTKYKYTGFPSLAKIQRSDPNSVSLSEDFAITWQQIFCSGSDYCNMNAISKRYHHRSVNGTQANAWYPLNNNQYFFISQDLIRNTVFPGIASIPNLTTGPSGNPGTFCNNFYSFGIMDKSSNLNGQIAYKSTGCNSTTLFTGKNSNGSTLSWNAEMTASRDLSAENNLFKKEGSSKIIFYPNPARGFLNIEISDSSYCKKIEILNVTGALIQTWGAIHVKQIQLSVTKFSKGYYFLKVYLENNKISIHKVIIL